MASNVSTMGLLSSSLGSSWGNRSLGSGSLDLDLESGLGDEEDPAKRPQAEALPKKRGEIGYRESLHERDEEDSGSSNSTEGTALPARHPQDRNSPIPPASATPSPIPNSAVPLAGTLTSTHVTTTSDASSAHSSGKHSLISFLKREQLPKIGGIRIGTLFRLAAHVILAAGTIAGWALAAMHVPKPADSLNGLNSTQVFVHVTFVIATLLQLIFLERIIFRVRAERYAHTHHGQVLLRNRNANTGNAPRRAPNPSMGFAPWNRPPLPTYAAALAANGLGTGDVEDNVIAIPPPPAYGNTRGSTLLLAGLMPENLRSQRMRERIRSGASETVRGSLASRLSRFTARTMRSSRASRPVSYRSHDSDWEERLDANRAMVLEETLAKLEEGKVHP